MNVYVLGAATHPAQAAIRDRRLEEMAFHTARAALDDAGVARNDLDQVTLAASDELDARGISSMLLAAPSGAYLKDELRVTDSGMMGLVMGALRVASGRFHLGLVVSWSQTSVLPLDQLLASRAEPFFLRPIGMNAAVADGLFAGAVCARYGISDSAVAARVHERSAAASRNPRAVARAVPSPADIAASACVAWPLRERQRAPITDGAVAMVLASPAWLERHPGARPLARISGMAWGVDSYRLDGERLAGMQGLRRCYAEAATRAGWDADAPPDVVELEAQNGWYDVAFTRALGLDGHAGVSPSGGAWAQNPYFCTGLVAAAEAVGQVAGRAGAHQVAGARRAIAHGTHGFAQQGHTVLAIEGIAR
jgi:acetyl-CoA acetyltransferase